MNATLAVCSVFPVVLFYIAAFILLYDFYKEMSKGTYTVLACGMMMIGMAGTAKAIWALLYYYGICDFPQLEGLFFPLMSLGFSLSGVAMVVHLFFLHPKLKKMTLAVAPVVFDGTMMFVLLTVGGMLCFYIALVKRAFQRKRAGAVVLYVISLISFMVMGMLVNWELSGSQLSEVMVCANYAAESALLGAILIMHKARLKEEFQEKLAVL